MKLVAKIKKNQSALNKAIRLGNKYITLGDKYEQMEVLSYTTDTVSDRRLETAQNKVDDAWSDFMEHMEDYLPLYEQKRVDKLLNI